ncbi:L,D-transpeptidase [Paenibacillus caui]|uniref:L,D-transpeptidase n=1 Tax=Paenibacillus caui TaxID=2873927 RepID=UPI001CA843E3|nr:L,D-transpeptidase [Paenibacillus caui]
MNNSAYLKDYVRMHPDNRMAWYLLGKEYEQSGQEGKANYCYMQAGDIYEAFESSKTPAGIWKEYAAELLEQSKRKARNRTRRRKWLTALMLLVLMCLSPYWTAQPKSERLGGPAAASASAVPDQGQGAVSAAADRSEREPSFTAKPLGTELDKADALSALLGGEAGQAKITGILGMQRKDSWLIWSRDMPLEYIMEREASAGRTSVQALNAATCGCKPPDSTALRQKAGDWIDNQELMALLTSAILHFKEETGHYPGKLAELNRPYPDNWIAGDAPSAALSFDKVLASVKQRAEGNGTAAGEPADAAKSSPDLEPYLHEPLEIKVDREKHLLALVSGNVILRIYKVGLGGGRTPEGTFQIVEKVINPNGRDDGEFGSRGMGLSGGNYAIHGTNEEDSIGKDESLGCVRMAKEDVEELFDLVPKGTRVTIGKGILPDLKPGAGSRFKLPDRQDQSNPHKTYHWLS